MVLYIGHYYLEVIVTNIFVTYTLLKTTMEKNKLPTSGVKSTFIVHKMFAMDNPPSNEQPPWT